MTIQLPGWMLLVILMFIGAYLGWQRGVRGFATITLVTAIAYIFFVSGVNQFLTYIDNIYMNIPKLLAIFTGGDPDIVASWRSIIPNFALSLPVRFVLFVALVALAWFFNAKPKWYKKAPSNEQEKQMGAFNGALVTLMWVSALSTFWRQATPEGTQGGTISNALNIIPDVSSVAPWLILLFFVVVIISIVQNIPKLWQA